MHSAVVTGVLLVVFVVCACERHEEKRTGSAPREVDVAVLTVTARDTPVTTEFVGQTQSSRQVEIRARVDGFLDKRLYTEGSMVKAGEVMFRMDPKPFQAQLNAAQGALAAQRARLQVAGDNLARVKPLTAQNALSEKDLDDAIGQEQAAAAAVETAKAQVEQAKLNLGYTVISSPLTGLSSYARVQEGAYVNALNSLLTYVAQTDPIWVNFSISENEVLRIRGETERGFYRAAKDGYDVEVVLADGSVFPKRGRITFANADYNPQTGTFLLRATLPNPEAALRPGQFVRVVILGGVRPNAVLVPQQAVLQGAKGHFVWIVDAEGKARIRSVQVGPWHGDQWFIDSGLAPGETVVVDGVMRLAEGAAVRIGEGGQRP
jgi:membrane fusion protein, multidrug efflux system